VQFTQLIARFRPRRRMYVPDDRFNTLVAFIEGANCLLHPDSPLDGFGDWLAHRLTGAPSSPLHWAAQIERHQAGGDLTAEQEEQACVMALDLIEEFLLTVRGEACLADW
jgi:hypothetical protein